MRRFLARLVIRRSQIDYVEICKNQFIIAGSVELIEGRLEPVNGMELFRRPKRHRTK